MTTVVKDGVDQETVETVQGSAGTYKYGWETDVEMDFAPKGLNEDIVRLISEKNGEPEWMTDWRLQAFRRWQEMDEPDWAMVNYPPIDYQEQYYYAQAQEHGEKPKSLDEVDPEAAAHLRKAGHPAEGADGARRRRRRRDAPAEGRKVAVDAVFDSVSVGTTFQAELERAGVIFCSISEAIEKHPELVKKYLGSVVPITDNSSRRSTRRSSRTARSSTSRRACAARWSCRPISASMPRTPASSSAR